MTVEPEMMRMWLGLSVGILTDDELRASIDLASDVVSDMVRSSGGSGISDSAVRYIAAANIYRGLDARNVKPASINLGGVSVSTDVGTAVQQFMEMGTKAVSNYVQARAGAGGRAEMYLHHVRGSPRCRR